MKAQAGGLNPGWTAGLRALWSAGGGTSAVPKEPIQQPSTATPIPSWPGGGYVSFRLLVLFGLFKIDTFRILNYLPGYHNSENESIVWKMSY